MTREGMHWRYVSEAEDLQRIVDALKSAPLSTMDLTLQCRVTAVSTCIGEIRNNPGYSVSPAIRIRRGTKYVYYYVLLQAPGWTPRWRVEGNRIVGFLTRATVVDSIEEDEVDITATEKRKEPTKTEGASPESTHVDSQSPSVAYQTIPPVSVPQTPAPTSCINDGCGNPVPLDRVRAGFETCSDECGRQYRERIKRTLAPGMLK